MRNIFVKQIESAHVDGELYFRRFETSGENSEEMREYFRVPSQNVALELSSSLPQLLRLTTAKEEPVQRDPGWSRKATFVAPKKY